MNLAADDAKLDRVNRAIEAQKRYIRRGSHRPSGIFKRFCHIFGQA